MVFLYSIAANSCFCIAFQVTGNPVPENKLPDDLLAKIDKMDVSVLIEDLGKARSIDRDGLAIQRSKIVVKAWLGKQVNYRNSLGGDLLLEKIRSLLKQEAIGRELTDALAMNEEAYVKFLAKYMITDDIMKQVVDLDQKVEKVDGEIVIAKKALEFYEEKLLVHRSKLDDLSGNRSPVISPPVKDSDLSDILFKAGQKRPESKNEVITSSSSMKLAQRFAK